jgi:hypothetical protein
VNQAEQLRDQQVQQEYSDQLGVYVQEKAEQIDRLQSSLAALVVRPFWMQRRQNSNC